MKLSKLLKYIDPFKNPPWDGDYPFDRELIKTMIETNNLESLSWDYGDNCAQTNEVTDKFYHVRRVAYLVVNKCNYPISIDVGIPEMGFEPTHLIFDGNHRYAAAVYRNDRTIPVEISGSVREAKRLFQISKI